MSLMKCPECGKEISDKSDICIGCGFPIKEYLNKTEEEKARKEKQEKELEQKYFCKSCYKQNEIGVDYCEFCGNRLTPYNKNICDENKKTEIYQKNKEHKPRKKAKIVWIVLGIIFLLWFAGSTSNDLNNETQESNKETIPSSELETQELETKKEILKDIETIGEEIKTEEQTEEEMETIEYDFRDGMDKYFSEEYLYITLEDLNKYHANMAGIKVFCVIEIDDIKDEKIQSNISDGYMMSNFIVVEKYENIKKGDVVAVLGEIGDYNDYGKIGKTLNLNNCYIFAKGENAKTYELSESDENLKKYFEITEEVANSNNDVSEEEFKTLCETYGHENIIRNPDQYKEKYCKLSGKVSQVIEGVFGSYTIYVKDSSSNIWGCTYSYKDEETHFLEGDNVTFYGILNGTQTSNTVLGKQVTMPYLKVKYIK